MLPKNLISVPLLADNTRTSFVSRTSLPGNKFAVSLASIGNSFTISVVTAIPETDLWCEKETVWVWLPTLAACARRTTPV